MLLAMLATCAAGACAAGDAAATEAFGAVWMAWRGQPGAAALTTQVMVREGDRESVAMAEPAVVAWDVDGPSLSFWCRGLRVTLSQGQLRARHAEGGAAVERPVGDRALRAWRDAFAEMPWPQPAWTLLPWDRCLSEMDPDIGPMEVTGMESIDDDRRRFTLRGTHGTFICTFAGKDHPRLVAAERRIESGPRVREGASVTWRMRCEPVEPERDAFELDVEGLRRVDRVQDVLPTREAPGERAPPAATGDTIAPSP
ncbi:MAG: hypothetical protein RLZZ558_1681 [Planctomycetota bacterium]|jgi:hypothetical protein